MAVRPGSGSQGAPRPRGMKTRRRSKPLNNTRHVAARPVWARRWREEADIAIAGHVAEAGTSVNGGVGGAGTTIYS